jgi:hypothetical protein
LLSLTVEQFYELHNEYIEMQKRDDKWKAITCATIANSYSSKHIKAEDFLPSLKEEKKAQTPEDMLAILQQFVK